mgnify:CR=1 FL=1
MIINPIIGLRVRVNRVHIILPTPQKRVLDTRRLLGNLGILFTIRLRGFNLRKVYNYFVHMVFYDEE